EGTSQEKRLYSLIWKRTLACQMADAVLEKTTATIQVSNAIEQFVATGEIIKFEGFLKVYRESFDNDTENEDESHLLPPLQKGQSLERKEVLATQRFTQRPARYTEASLVHKLEELGIGRPSTYAPTISTIQQREYVEKGEKEGIERSFFVISLRDDKIEETDNKELYGAEKNKLLPTDVGLVVNDFLLDNFPDIMDYNFTANIEKEFDEVAEGNKDWVELMSTFYKGFAPKVEETMAMKSDHKVGERQLGLDPKSGKPVFVKIGRFGPVVQIGSASDEEKPRFAQIKRGQSTETITLDEALELFKLPRTLGEFEETKVIANTGRFGPYIQLGKKYASLPKEADPMTITLEEAIKVIEEKRKTEAERHIKSFEEAPGMELLNGRFGPYIAFDKKNYRLPKNLVERAAELTLEECKEIIKAQDEKPKTTTRRRPAKK
ncbi:MAG: DNA topoisomerase, partial [Bacteroidaceae bacterium]